MKKRKMKLFKTVVAVALAALGGVALFAACGKGGENQSGNGKGIDATPSPVPQPQPEPIPAITATIDTTRLRYNQLRSFEVNDTPILTGVYNLYNFEVERVDDAEYPYRAWVFGESTGDPSNPDTGYDSIFHGRSKDLQHWEMWCGDSSGKAVWDSSGDPSLWVPVLRRADKKYDSVHNGDPSAVYRNGRFYMAFSCVGFDNRGGITYIVNNIMGAVSDDGIHWTKTDAPILIWDREYTEGWEAGTPCPPSTGGYHRPSLMWDEEEQKWKMWFDYYLPGTFLSMGYAVNSGDFTDPSHWQLIHAEETPQLKDWPNPEVTKIDGKYYAFSDAPGYGVSRGGAQNDRQLVMAVSDNGWDWRVAGRILPEGKEWGTHLPQTFVDTAPDGVRRLYLFYSMTDKEHLPKYVAENYCSIPVSELAALAAES
ncbi:MAG: hypothetical protein J5950_09820 [Clostridia bacterium]|nr:hypothetical protein [Clostridia bacterium]